MRQVCRWTLSMLLSEFVEHIGGIEAGIVTELARYHFQRLCHAANQQLLLAGNCT